jgi:hypothetical protein
MNVPDPESGELRRIEERCVEGFRSQLAGFELETLERDPHSVFALSTKLALVYFNPAYLQFSAENGGQPGVTARFPVGTSVLDAIGGPMKGFYEEKLTKVVATGTPWYHQYTCHSADLHREFHQAVYPLKNSSGLVLINSSKIETPMSARGREAHVPIEARYVQATGLLTQCSNCRRTLRNDDSQVWDWVPHWVSDMPPNTSHSICPTCSDYYWR